MGIREISQIGKDAKVNIPAIVPATIPEILCSPLTPLTKLRLITRSLLGSHLNNGDKGIILRGGFAQAEEQDDGFARVEEVLQPALIVAAILTPQDRTNLEVK